MSRTVHTRFSIPVAIAGVVGRPPASLVLQTDPLPLVGGIWPIPRSRAYCSGCLAPGLGLAGHTTGVQTGASGPNLGTRPISVADQAA
jgi:hypothetical protein